MKTARKTSGSDTVFEGSGNVFADLGLPNTEQKLTKARLTLQIAQIIRDFASRDKPMRDAALRMTGGHSTRSFQDVTPLRMKGSSRH